MEAPPRDCMVIGNVESRESTSRGITTFKATAHATDSGVILWDPAGYYCNLSLTGVKDLLLWLSQWHAYQRERFKPTGFALVNLTTGEKRERKDGEAIVLVGDSFYIRNTSGEDLTGALSLTEWEMQPLFS